MEIIGSESWTIEARKRACKRKGMMLIPGRPSTAPFALGPQASF